jgi:hypothetical protein
MSGKEIFELFVFAMFWGVIIWNVSSFRRELLQYLREKKERSSNE